MKSLLVKVLLGFPSLLSPAFALVQNPSATVVSIGDGDALRIRLSGQVTTIRLGCIDAPERSPNFLGDGNQPLGLSNCYRQVQQCK